VCVAAGLIQVDGHRMITKRVEIKAVGIGW
jgi:hypothetical protein